MTESPETTPESGTAVTDRMSWAPPLALACVWALAFVVTAPWSDPDILTDWLALDVTDPYRRAGSTIILSGIGHISLGHLLTNAGVMIVSVRSFWPAQAYVFALTALTSVVLGNVASLVFVATQTQGFVTGGSAAVAAVLVAGWDRQTLPMRVVVLALIAIDALTLASAGQGLSSLPPLQHVTGAAVGAVVVSVLRAVQRDVDTPLSG